MTDAPSTYQDFARHRAQTAELLEAVAAAFELLDATERCRQIRQARQTLLDDTFKVLIIGEFKWGKSTFINAMLGQSILPAKVAPCTAVITRVRFGQKKSATLYYKDDRLPLQLDLERQPDALRKHVAIEHSHDGLGKEPVTPYAAAEVLYPLPLCQNNVEIVDSPGLNEHATRTEVTRSFMGKADAMVMVLSCEKQLSQTEIQFIDQELADRDLRDVFFVWNRFDAVRDSPSDLAELHARSRTRLEPLVGGRARIFFVSARDGLNGRLQHDARLLQLSNLPAFEAALEQFLASERARVKLRMPLRVAENAIHEGLAQLIPYRENLFRKPLDEIRKQLDQQRPRLDEIERQRDRILRGVRVAGEVMIRELQASLRTLIAQTEIGLSQQVQQIEIGRWETLISQTAVRERVGSQLTNWMNGQMEAWRDHTVAQLLQTHLQELQRSLADQGRELLDNVDQIRASFDARMSSPQTSQPIDEASVLSRLTGTGLGVLMMNPGLAIEGASAGMGQFARGLGVQFATAAGLSMLGFGAPVIMPVLLGVSVYRTFTHTRSAGEQIRAAVVADLSSRLREVQPEIEQEVAQQISEKLDELHRLVDERMSVLVDDVRGQVQQVIAERERHEANTATALAELDHVASQLREQSSRLLQIRKEQECEPTD